MKNKLKKTLFFAFLLAILYFLYSFVLASVYSKVCADVIYSGGILPYVIEFAMELCQFLIWCNIFAYIITTPTVFTYVYIGVLTALRYFLIPIIALITSDGETVYLLSDALKYTLFDFIQIALIGVSSAVVLRNKNIALKDLKSFGKIGRALTPYRSMTVISAVFLSAVRIVMRVIFDISYGAPQSFKEILYMVLYYSFDLFYGFASYIFIVFMLKFYRKKDS